MADVIPSQTNPDPGAVALLPDEIVRRLQDLPHWKVVEGALQRIHTCHAYLASLALLNAIGQLAEQYDHHPDLMLNYKRLTVRYWTFRAKGITALDFEMASRVEALIASLDSEQ
jgi:4a-hydroxytetrahydrobiopterin dehydratase